MEDPIAVGLKFGFLAVLYLFLLWVARSSLRDLRGTADAGARDEPRDSGDPVVAGAAREPAGAPTQGAAPALEVIAAMGHEPGHAFEIGAGATIGRSDRADVYVEDPFASAAHARVFPRGGLMYIEDMGSTNGTFLNGRQVQGTEPLSPGDVMRIGDSEYRYRE